MTLFDIAGLDDITEDLSVTLLLKINESCPLKILPFLGKIFVRLVGEDIGEFVIINFVSK